MPFEQTLKAVIEEELIEVATLCQNMAADIEKVVADIEENERLDKQNDRSRREINRSLSAAIREHSRSRFEEANANVHAAQQRLLDQELIDLSDDSPRTAALMKLAQFKAKLESNERVVKSALKKLNADVPAVFARDVSSGGK